jgi:hypothetical protein
LAVADGSVDPDFMMGITQQEIPNNGFGYVKHFGLVRGFRTNGSAQGETWSDGDILYFDADTPGGLTNVKPISPAIHEPIAVVVTASQGNNGSIFVRMKVSESLATLRDVYVNGSLTNGDVLIYDVTQDRFEANTLTAGANISITNGPGSITISSAGGAEIDPIFTASPAFGITSGDISNWDTAYGWGNHALAGYLTSYTETDPTVPAHVKSITTTNISNWNTAYGWGDHSAAGYLTSFTETDPTVPSHVKSITTTNISNWNTAYGWGNHATAGYQAAATALTTSTTFGGDVSGTYNAIVVADDSHNHIISNVDGLQTALDGKLSTTGKAADSNLFDNLDSVRFVYGSNQYATSNGRTDINNLSKTGHYWSSSATNKPSTGNGTTFHINHDGGTSYATQMFINHDGNDGAYFRAKDAGTWNSWQRIFSDDYHPNADTLTTARTISLTGDVSGSTSFNGSANVSITATVADDSHNHIISNVDGLQGELDSRVDYFGGAVNSSASYVSGFESDTRAGLISASTNSTGSTNFPTGYGATWSFRAVGGSSSSNWHRHFDLHKANGDNAHIYARGRRGSDGAPLAWQQLFSNEYAPFANLTSKTSGTGTYQTSGDFRAPIFYDSDNTGFNLNANGSAWQLQTPTGYLRAGPMNTGFCHFNTDRARYYFDKEVQFDGGINDYSGNWRFNDSLGQHDASLRAPIFYDSNNTAYYVDPASGTNLAGNINQFSGYVWLKQWAGSAASPTEVYDWPYPALTVSAFGNYTQQTMLAFALPNDGNYFTGDSVWNFRLNQTANSTTSAGVSAMNFGGPGILYLRPSWYTQSTGSLRAPLFYDSNNTAYYADFGSTGSSIRTAGPVSVGTTSSAVQLTVAGAGGVDGIELQVDTTSSVNSGRMFWTNGTAGQGVAIYNGSGNMYLTTGATPNSTSGGTRMAIYSGNYVTASGSFRAPVFYDSNNTGRYADLSSTGDSIRASGDIVAYYSDDRLKDRGDNIANALDKVQSLNGFHYTANETAQKFGYKANPQVGVSAQEVEAVLPEVVKDAAIGHGYKTVDYAKLVPLLIEAIKELKAEVETLKKG